MATEPTTPKTPEQVEAEAFFKEHGLQEGTLVTGTEDATVVTSEPPTEIPAPVATELLGPTTPPAAAVPAGPSLEDQLKEMQGRLKAAEDKAGWAEREKERADRYRDQSEREHADNERMRLALGVPSKPTAPAREFSDEEKRGIAWVKDALTHGGVLAEALKELPAEALASHPAIIQRDIALGRMRDALDQTRFLSGFEPKQAKLIATRVLPSLQAMRHAGNYQKTYEDLWEDQRKAASESAELYGLMVGQPAAAPATVPAASPVAPAATPRPAAAPVSVPPTALGVPGSSASPTTPPPQPLTRQELAFLGLADGPFS